MPDQKLVLKTELGPVYKEFLSIYRSAAVPGRFA